MDFLKIRKIYCWFVGHEPWRGLNDQGTNAEFTVVQKFNQGTLRHRAVIDGGALFGSFLGKQKGTTKKSKEV